MPAMMPLISWGVPSLVVVALIWVTLSGRDAWPFSAYPMFSAYRAQPVVPFYRLHFVLPENQVRPLPVSAGGIADEFNVAFANTWMETVTSSRETATALVRQYLDVAIRFEPALSTTERIEVWVRVAQLGRDRGAVVAEKIVFALVVRERGPATAGSTTA